MLRFAILGAAALAAGCASGGDPFVALKQDVGCVEQGVALTNGDRASVQKQIDPFLRQLAAQSCETVRWRIEHPKPGDGFSAGESMRAGLTIGFLRSFVTGYGADRGQDWKIMNRQSNTALSGEQLVIRACGLGCDSLPEAWARVPTNNQP